MGTELRVQNGAAAIWTDERDALPFTAPLSHVNRLKFHSALDYIQIIDVKTFTLTVPAISGLLERTASYTLGAHGRPGVPLFLAKINVNGTNVAFSASVPVHRNELQNDFLARWLAIGADATNFIVHEYAIQSGTAGAPDGMMPRPAQTFQITCYVTDVML